MTLLLAVTHCGGFTPIADSNHVVLIRRVSKEFKLTTVYVTHDQKEALSTADRIAVLQDGRLAQVSTVTSNVGSRISLIGSVNNSLTSQSTTVQTQISNLSSLDYAAATSQYSQEYVALQAAEQSYADINQLSLFKYL